MNLIYLNLVILIFTQNAFSLENYFNNSIIRILRDNKLEFASDLSLNFPDVKIDLIDNYSFKLKSGTFKYFETFKNGETFDNKIIFLNNVDEIYDIDLTGKKCIVSKGDDKLIYSYLRGWIPDRTMINRNKHILLGPNSLIIYLLDSFDTNKEAIKCEDLIDPNRNNPKKCTIQKNLSDGERSFKVEYYFENRGEFTMYPFLIKKFDRFSSHSKWQKEELKYLNFKPNFNMKKPIVDLSLPKGIKCKRE